MLIALLKIMAYTFPQAAFAYAIGRAKALKLHEATGFKRQSPAQGYMVIMDAEAHFEDMLVFEQ